MKRPSRELSIFNLSALDVLAMATGTFVLLVVILMPYYRRVHDANAEIEAAQAEAQTLQAVLEEEQSMGALAASEADELRAEAQSLMAQIAAQKAAIAVLESETAATLTKAGEDEQRMQQMKAVYQKKIIPMLDVVFVVDTTSSMANVLYEMTQSMSGIVRILERLVPSLRIGVVAYRDHDLPGWVVRSLPPTNTRRSAREIYDFIAALRPARGGPTPEEAVHSGLLEALSMPLRRKAQQSIIIIGDAATHRRYRRGMLEMARDYAGRSKRHTISTLFVPTESYRYFGGDDPKFFRAIAKAGGGTFSQHEGQLFEAVLVSILDE